MFKFKYSTSATINKCIAHFNFDNITEIIQTNARLLALHPVAVAAVTRLVNVLCRTRARNLWTVYHFSDIA